MRKLWLLKPVFHLLLLGFGEADQGGGHSTCVTSGTVVDGDPATVQCYFNRLHKKFMVYRLSASSEVKEQIVLVCTHTERGPICNNPDGHNVTVSRAKDEATIRISSATQENSGTYFCKTLPAREDKAGNCTLIVQSSVVRTGSLVTCKVSSPLSLGQKANVVCEYSKAVGNTGIMLKKHSAIQDGDHEGILKCERGSKCELKKKGYSIEEVTDTHVIISIPYVQTENLGHYVCMSASMDRVKHTCELKQVPGIHTSNAEQSVLPHAVLVTGIVTFIGLFGMLCGILALLFCLYKRRSNFRRQPVPKDEMETMSNVLL